MNRPQISWLSLSFVCAAGAMIACGPRMKPVEYEEPKDLSSGSELDSPPSGDSSAASPASSSETKSDEGSTSSPAVGGSCKDKKCGETCSECPPGDETCMEVLVLRQCNLKGECVPANVSCSGGSEGGSKGKDAKGKDAKSKGGK